MNKARRRRLSLGAKARRASEIDEFIALELGFRQKNEAVWHIVTEQTTYIYKKLVDKDKN